MTRNAGVGPFALGTCALVARASGTLSLRRLEQACDELRRQLPAARVWLRAVSAKKPTDTTVTDDVVVTSGDALIEIDGADAGRAASLLDGTARILALPCSVESAAAQPAR